MNMILVIGLVWFLLRHVKCPCRMKGMLHLVLGVVFALDVFVQRKGMFALGSRASVGKMNLVEKLYLKSFSRAMSTMC